MGTVNSNRKGRGGERGAEPAPRGLGRPGNQVMPEDAQADHDALVAEQAEMDAAGTAAGDDELGTFDPAKHTVPQVLAYVEQYPEERDRIANAEAENKARHGILDALA